MALTLVPAADVDLNGLMRKCRQCKSEKLLAEFNCFRVRGHNVPKNMCVTCECRKEEDVTLDSYFRYIIRKSKERIGYIHKTFQGDFELTSELLHELWTKQGGRCKLSGLNMTFRKTPEEVRNSAHARYLVSVDRIDSDVNYTKDNIQLVCSVVNFMKRDLTDGEFIKLSNLIADFNENKD